MSKIPSRLRILIVSAIAASAIVAAAPSRSAAGGDAAVMPPRVCLTCAEFDGAIGMSRAAVPGIRW